MALYIIDTDTPSLQFDQITQLEGVEYLFFFFWNDQDNSWYINLYDQDGNPIALLIRLACSADLLRRFTDPRLPPGFLFMPNLSGADADMAQASDLSSGNFPLCYITSDDVDA